MNKIQARGKLLISSEYMVLHGSSALVLPLKKTQSLRKTGSAGQNIFTWKAYYKTDLWFHAAYRPNTLDIVRASDPDKALRLQELLRACKELNPMFQQELVNSQVETDLDFSPEWGFGSSSTLTALLARWAGVNAMDLHFMTSEGSGFDVACAMADGPILYRLLEGEPHFEPVSFHPPFADRIYFVWLGSKQSTAKHLRDKTAFLDPGGEDIRAFSGLTRQMLEVRDIEGFLALLEEHEARLSGLTGQPRVSRVRFPGLQGSVKSLGAWGGDFVMIASLQDHEELYNYLDQLGFSVRFRYNELIHHG